MQFVPRERTTGELIRQAREARKLSRADLARMASMQEQTLYRWEIGHSRVKDKKLAKLCLLLGVPVGSLRGVD